MVHLENEFLKVAVSSEGAELHSAIDKRSGKEHIWQADPSVWGWHAPNLFPVIGRCIDNQLMIDGKPYTMEKHGFTRTAHFKRVEASATHAKFSLHYNEDTFSKYPYKFEFQVLYDLIDNCLRVSYKVINKDDKTILFSLGAHPAFNVPFYSGESLEDYFVEFEKDEPLEKHLISPDGYFTGESEPVQTEGRRIRLTKDIFNDDALVFKKIVSRKLYLKSDRHQDYIEVSFPHMDYLGIWSKPGANFVCIEPWLGCGDSKDKVTDIREKEGIQSVEHGHVFETDFTIGFYSSAE